MRMVLNLGVPRTGTRYVEETLSNIRRPHAHWHLVNSDWSHIAFRKVPPEYAGDYIIGVVRNPFDLLVSNYELIAGIEVLMHHYDRTLVNLEFREWLDLIAHRQGKYPKRYPLHFQYFDADWNLGLNYLARFETLDEDLARIAEITGGTFTPRPPVNQSKTRGAWRQYYDEPMLQLVEDAWYADLAYFGYSRDGWDESKAMTTFGPDPKPRARLKARHPDVPWTVEETFD